MILDLKNWIDRIVWGDLLRQHGLPGRVLTGVLRNSYAVLRDIFSGQLSLRSMSLVYTTLLSVVPLIAFSFSALKGLGVHEDLEPYLANILEPLGTKSVEITNQIMDIVENVNGSVLGGIGLAVFFYTAISMVQKIEESFNYVWYVTEPRGLAKRFVEYSAVLVIGSLAIALTINAVASIASEDIVVSLQDSTALRPVIDLTNSLTPFLVVMVIFTFLYMFMPNTTVKFRSALVGGIAGGVLWGLTSKLFATFITISTGREAIYASFAIAITALIWLYLNWLILLIGSQIAFYFQNPAYLRIGRREPRLSNAMRERLALNIMFAIGCEFRRPTNGLNLRALSRQLRIPSITVAPIAAALEANGLLTSNDQEALMPGREMTRIQLIDIINVVRVDGETGSHRNPKWSPAIDELGHQLDDAVMGVVGDQTLADLLNTAAAKNRKTKVDASLTS